VPSRVLIKASENLILEDEFRIRINGQYGLRRNGMIFFDVPMVLVMVMSVML
jgi:sensor domain CHASE-containing protein